MAILNKKNRIKNVKLEINKLSSTFKSCSFNIIYWKGIDRIEYLIELGHEYGVLKIYGKSITYLDTKHDGVTFRTLLEDNDELQEEIRNKILEASRLVEPIIEEKE